MKNTGITFGLCAIGLGLITIGLNLGTTSVAATTAHTPQRSMPHTGDSCTLTIFEPVLQPFPGDCPVPTQSEGLGGATIDLLGTGTPQLFSSPQYFRESESPNRLFLLTADGPIYDSVDFSFTGDLDYDAFLGVAASSVTGWGLLDVDRDGHPDLVLKVATCCGSNSTVRLGWVRNIYEGVARLPADLNDDGRVDGADLGELFVQWTG